MNEALKNLQVIPGVGKMVSQDLYSLGIRKVSDLIGKDGQKLYSTLCKKAGVKIDRCMLYTFRCAIYFAETPQSKQDKELLKWWNWKD